MLRPDSLILYVDDPRASAAFYGSLFGFETIESHPAFALLDLGQGLNLGFWSRGDVKPEAAAVEPSGEIAFRVEDRTEADAFYANAKARGLEILQEPVELDFGYALVVADPDGYRLRVFVPGCH